MIVMHEATLNDSRAVLELSNDPSVRAASFETNRINAETHRKWYATKLADRSCIFVLFYEDEKLIAQIRFDIDAELTGETSISVASLYRGEGIACGLMAKAIEFACKKKKIKKIRA